MFANPTRTPRASWPTIHELIFRGSAISQLSILPYAAFNLAERVTVGCSPNARGIRSPTEARSNTASTHLVPSTPTLLPPVSTPTNNALGSLAQTPKSTYAFQPSFPRSSKTAQVNYHSDKLSRFPPSSPWYLLKMRPSAAFFGTPAASRHPLVRTASPAGPCRSRASPGLAIVLA